MTVIAESVKGGALPGVRTALTRFPQKTCAPCVQTGVFKDQLYDALMSLPNEFDVQAVLQEVVRLADCLARRLNGNPRVDADSIKDTCTNAIQSGNSERQLYAFGIAAKLANSIAKRALNDWVEALSYEVKNLCLGALISSGRTKLNSIGPDNAVGIDLFTPPSRLHTFPWKLKPYAAVTLRAQMQALANSSQTYRRRHRRTRF